MNEIIGALHEQIKPRRRAHSHPLEIFYSCTFQVVLIKLNVKTKRATVYGRYEEVTVGVDTIRLYLHLLFTKKINNESRNELTFIYT